jgi:predicted CXXCH cytochrome family protein
LTQREKCGDHRVLSKLGASVLGNAPAAAAVMKYTPRSLIGFCLLLLAAMQASAVEHPGILPKDANCSTCHADKTSGKSVHSAMAISCTVCHLIKTEGDMTTMDLAMPREQICFACHEKSAELQQHSPIVKGQCVDCHDTHSSVRRLLLRRQTDVRHAHLPAVPIPHRKRRPQGGRSTVTSKQFPVPAESLGVSQGTNLAKARQPLPQRPRF